LLPVILLPDHLCVENARFCSFLGVHIDCILSCGIC